MLCSSLLSQLPFAKAGEQEAPWSPSMLCSSLKWLGLRDKSRWVHSLQSKRSAGTHLTGSVSKDTGGLDCIWLWLPNSMSASL